MFTSISVELKGLSLPPAIGVCLVVKGAAAITCGKHQPVSVAAVGSTKFSSKSNGAVWGNILAGGIIGYAVDASSGAGFDYPTMMTITLPPPCGTSSPKTAVVD